MSSIVRFLMISFQLEFPPKVDFGWGNTNNLPRYISQFGDRALIFTGSNSLYDSGIAGNLFDLLKDGGINYTAHKINEEPSVILIDELAATYRTLPFDCIVAIGGGSVIDTAKAVSVMLFNEGSVADYIERVGDKLLSGKSLPVIAIPSTPGSGSEVNDIAVIVQRGENCFKSYLRGSTLIPRVAIVDPSLLITLTPEKMLFCIMECLSQLVEVYVAKDSNIFTDTLIIDAIKLLISNLDDCVRNSTDTDAIEAIAYAAMLSGIGSANTHIGMHHGLVLQIGAFYDIPHAAICASVLSSATVVNMRKVQMFDPNSEATARYAMIGAAFSGLDYVYEKHHVLLRAVTQTFQSICDTYQIPKLQELGVEKDDFYKIASAASQSQGDYVELAETEIIEILEMSY
jgi:alcohol dehydrogenase class IV